MFHALLVAALLAVGANCLAAAYEDWLGRHPVYLARDLTMGVLCLAAGITGIVE
jgi:hypothetical protein